jgi:hypothetical protein
VKVSEGGRDCEKADLPFRSSSCTVAREHPTEDFDPVAFADSAGDLRCRIARFHLERAAFFAVGCGVTIPSRGTVAGGRVNAVE